MAIAGLDQRPVTFLDILLDGLLLKSDLAGLLKVLLADLLLGRVELRDIGVVTLLHIFVRALEDRVLLQRCDRLFRLDAAKACVWVILAAAEVNTSSNRTALLAPLTGHTVVSPRVTSMIGRGRG